MRFKKMNNIRYVALFGVLVLCTFCFSLSYAKSYKENITVEIYEKEIKINNKHCRLIGKKANELRQAFGEPDFISGTFGGFDYFYYDYDISPRVKDDNNIESIDFCFYNLKEFIENHKYEKGRISGVNVDGLFLTPNSKYEDISNLLFNKKIICKKKENRTSFIIAVDDFKGKYLFMRFDKENENKILNITIAEAYVFTKK